MSDYLVWTAAAADGVCRLGELAGVDRQAEIRFNHSRAKGWPGDATFAMDPDSPEDTELADCLQNLPDLLVVSGRTVDLLRRLEVGPVEFLPVTVKDHRGRPVDGDYHIVNPLEPVACLDLPACKPKMSNLLPDKVSWVQHLVLDAKRIDAKRKLFCCDRYHDPRLVHRSLAQAVTDAGLTGNRFVELARYRA